MSAAHVEPAVVETPKDGRANYNYSVIPGGARDPQELAHAIQTDSVVADHYRDVDPASMRPERVPADRLAYVSYRKNDQVFWTKNKVRIYEGETILTNGDTEIRGRCGNAISMAPMLPTADDEPDTAVFDALTDDGPRLVAFDLTPWGVPGLPPDEVGVPPATPGIAGPLGFGGGAGGVGGVPSEVPPGAPSQAADISPACGVALARVQRMSAEAFPAGAITLADSCATDPTGPGPAGDPTTFTEPGSDDATGDPPLELQPLLPEDPGFDDPPDTPKPDPHLNPTPVPEPTTLLLFGSGIAGLLARHRRKKSN